MADFFKQITDSITSFNQQKEGSVVGVDIGSAFIKVVQLKKKRGKAILETYGELALGPYAGVAIGQATQLSPEKVAEALIDVMHEANVTTKNAGVSLPLQSSLLSFMKMPDLDDKRLAELVPIEARKYIPVPISEVSIDWWVLPKEEKHDDFSGESSTSTSQHTITTKDAHGMIDVLAVAILNETIKHTGEVIKKSALEHSFLELEVFSVARSTFGFSTAPFMIVDFGVRSTKISVIEHGIIRSQHVVNRGSQNITIAIAESISVTPERAEALKREFGLTGTGNDTHASETAQLVVDYILNEVQAVLLNYERTNNKIIKQIIMTGGGALLKGLYESADKVFETELTYADPFNHTEAPVFLHPVLRDAGPEFSVAVGLALRKLEEQE